MDLLPVRLYCVSFAFIVSAAMTGCSGKPSRIKQQALDPATAAAAAMDAYDSNGDAVLDEKELKASPPLSSAMLMFDLDADGQLTKDEVRNRLSTWIENKSALFPIPCTIKMQGRPLSNATIEFEPEPFLGDSFQVARGVTDAEGMTSLSVSEGPYSDLPGIPSGLYRIRISKIDGGKERVPAKYNEQTALGQEICDDAAGLGQGLVFNLKPR